MHNININVIICYKESNDFTKEKVNNMKEMSQNDLKKKINSLREELEKQLNEENTNLTEIIRLSEELDQLINRYNSKTSCNY